MSTRTEIWPALLAAIALVTLGAVWISLQLGFRHKAWAVLEWDHHRYIAMARPTDERLGLPEAREAPFLWRVLAPMLVERMTRLGLHIHTAFYLLTTSSLVGFLTCLFLYLREKGLAPPDAFLGMALAGLIPGVMRWYQYQYWMTDPLCLFLMVLALLAIEAHHDAATVGISVLGVLTRETFVLVLAYAVLRRYEEKGADAALKFALVLLPAPLLTLLALHTFMVPQVEPVAIGSMVRDVVSFRTEFLFINQIYFATLGSFGIVAVLSWLSVRAVLRAIPRRPSTVVFILGAFASLFLGNNTDRLLAYIVPVVLPFSLWQLRAVAAHSRLSWSALARMALAVQVVLFCTSPSTGRPGLSVYQPNNWCVVAAAATFLLVTGLSMVRSSLNSSTRQTAA